MRYLPLLCEHESHGVQGSERVGKSYGHWVPCDAHMGPLIYCGAHLRVHDVGWCSATGHNKIPMRSLTLESAYEEAEKMGLHLYDPN